MLVQYDQTELKCILTFFIVYLAEQTQDRLGSTEKWRMEGGVQVNSSWPDQEWELHFRMRKTTFHQLCDFLIPQLQRQPTSFRNHTITIAIDVASAIVEKVS